MPETLEQVLARLDPDAASRVRATLNAGTVLQDLLADADAARAIIPLADKVAKKRNPAHMTTAEIAAPIVEQALAQVDAKLAARDAKVAEEAATASLAAAIAKAKADDGFTDEGIKNVLDLMRSNGIADFEAAALKYRQHNPLPKTPSPGASERMDWGFYHEIQSGDQKAFFDGTATHSPAMIDDPEAWQRAAALKYLSGEIGLPTS